jgi:hypothetical protein
MPDEEGRRSTPALRYLKMMIYGLLACPRRISIRLRLRLSHSSKIFIHDRCLRVVDNVSSHDSLETSSLAPLASISTSDVALAFVKH